jgi:hypothetical protein
MHRRRKEKAARRAAQKPLWGPPPPANLTSTLSGELVSTVCFLDMRFSTWASTDGTLMLTGALKQCWIRAFAVQICSLEDGPQYTERWLTKRTSEPSGAHYPACPVHSSTEAARSCKLWKPGDTLQAVTLFSSATLAKQRLQMFRGGLRSLLSGEFGALRAEGQSRRAAAARLLAEDQAREKVRLAVKQTGRWDLS